MVEKEDFILITGGSGFIGTNLIELFEQNGYSFVNFDKVDAINPKQHKYWYYGNIMNKDQLSDAFIKFKPTIVIHLAARTDTSSDVLEDYIENIEGTENVVNEIKKHGFVKHALFASTQYVYKNKIVPFPVKDDDYCPHTVYGISKMINEKYIRSANMKCKWTIFRPCNVWGPWHMRYPNELWKFIAKGLFVQPSRRPNIRTYAYVKNLVKQLDAIMNAPDIDCDKKMYYLGDYIVDSYEWLNGLSHEISGKNVLRVPKFFFWVGAVLGDFLGLFGIKFPLYSVRYRNMIEDYYAPANVTMEKFGIFQSNHAVNCKETIDWLRGEGASLFEYWKSHPHGEIEG